MRKKIGALAIALCMSASGIPSVAAEEETQCFGFEDGEENWSVSASNGRCISGIDNTVAKNGNSSYKFDFVAATDSAAELSQVTKEFDVEYGKALEIDASYLVSEEYRRIDGKNGGAFIKYSFADKYGFDISGSEYYYYIPMTDDIDVWKDVSIYALPTKDAVSMKLSIGMKTSTGRVNFDDISVRKIERSEMGTNPVQYSQATAEGLQEEYTTGFESSDTDYWKFTATSGDASAGIVKSDSHTGEACYRFQSYTDNKEASNNKVITNNKNGSFAFVVQPGIYELSWWYKIDKDYVRFNSNMGMSVAASVYNSDGSEVKNSGCKKTYLVTEADGEWKKSTYTIAVGENGERIRMNIGMRACKGTFKIDDICLKPIKLDTVTEPDLENYDGMTVRRIDDDSVYINIDTEESKQDNIMDYVVLGDEESESAHNFDPGKSAVGYGEMGDSYRRLYPGADPMWVTLKVNPDKMNYITVKLWGSERQNKQSQCLIFSDEYGSLNQLYGTNWGVWDYMYTEPSQRDSYFYATYRIPRSMTYGKTEVRFKIFHYGDYSAYSANGYADATEYSRQLYKIITHTDTKYDPMPDDKNGTTKRYDLGKIAVSPNGLSPYDYIINEMNASIEEVLKSQNYGPEWEEAVRTGRSPKEATGACLEGLNSMTHGSFENWKGIHYSKCIGSNGENIKGFRTAAMAYNREWSNYYHDPEIVDRAVAWLDYYVRAQGSDGAWQNATVQWIGGPDRKPSNLQMEAGERAIGEVFLELYEPIKEGGYLEQFMDDDLNPDTPMISRKQAYINMFCNASDFVFNKMDGLNRRTSVNQDLFCVVSGVNFERCLDKLDKSKRILTEEQMKVRMYEATGIIKAPHESIQISPKGLSMETHGHLQGAYDGNYGMHGASMAVDLAYLANDDKITQKALNAQNALSYFMETTQDADGNIAIRKEDNINTRNYKGPGRVEYAAWNNFSGAGLGSKASLRSFELFIEYGELYKSSLVNDRRLLYYMIKNMDCMGDAVKKASENYKTFADISGIEQEAAIVTLATKGIADGINNSNFAPTERIDEATFNRWCEKAFGENLLVKYNITMTRAQAANEIYYALLNGGVYITKFDLGSGIYFPNEPWNVDENGREQGYTFCDEIAESFAFKHEDRIIRGTMNWRSEYSSNAREDRNRAHATTSQVVRFHEMNDGYSSHGNAYMTSPLGLRRVDIAKYGRYIIIMNCSDEDKPVNIDFDSNAAKIKDIVSGEMLDVNSVKTMDALSTIILDTYETEGVAE